MMLTPHALWINTQNYVRAQLPEGVGEHIVSEVATKVYAEMKFLVERPWRETPQSDRGVAK